MNNAADHVSVGGDFITDSWLSHDGYLTNGLFEVKGDFIHFTEGGIHNQ
jgi:hypothetical protein